MVEANRHDRGKAPPVSVVTPSPQVLRDLAGLDAEVVLSVYIEQTESEKELEIRRKHAVSDARDVLDRNGVDPDVGARTLSTLEASLEHIAKPRSGWSSAIFATPKRARVVTPLEPVDDMVLAGTRPHLVSLASHTVTAPQCFVLKLSLGGAALYVASGAGLTKLDVDMPSQLEAVTGEDDAPPYLGGHSVGGEMRFHGQGESDRDNAMVRRYFREVDEAVASAMPPAPHAVLLVAALPRWQGFYRDVSKLGARLSAHEVAVDPESLDHEDLLQAVAAVRESHREQSREQAIGKLAASESARRARGQDVAKRAKFAAVGTLFVREGATLSENGARPRSTDEDLVASAVADAIATDARVVFVPPDDMPGGPNEAMCALLRRPVPEGSR